MNRARPGCWRRRSWGALALLVSAGLVTGLAGTALPPDAAAQDSGGTGLLPGVDGLLPLPSSSPTSSEPSSGEPVPPEPTAGPSTSPVPSTSQGPSTSRPLLPLPGGEKPPSTGENPPPASDEPGSPSLLPSPTAPPPSTSPLPGFPPPRAPLPGAAPPPPPSLPTGAPADPRPGPGRAWTLTGSSLKLSGSHYHGYSDQQVAGRPVKTLHFTVDRLEITDLVQRGDLGNGKIIRTAGAPGSVSTVINGPIELYTEQLSGTLAVGGQPTVPLKLSPEALSLPNLDLSFLRLPDLTFKDVVVDNAGLSGGQLRIPGARISLE